MAANLERESREEPRGPLRRAWARSSQRERPRTRGRQGSREMPPENKVNESSADHSREARLARDRDRKAKNK
eukprot:682910-Hanusia_phi.AAC.1